MPRSARAAWAGLGLAIVLATLAMAVPATLDWDVHVRWFPPLHADWDPRVGWGTLPALVLGVLAWRYAVDLAARLSWGRLLGAAYAGGLAWMLALALVDGIGGVGDVLDHPYEYLSTARATTDLPATLAEYVSRIPVDSPGQWPVHIAGHPPGALTFFVLLVRLGLGSGLAAGLVVTLLAASTALAVLQTHAGARRRTARATGRAVPGHRAGRRLAVRVGGRDVRRLGGLGDVRAGAGRRGFIVLAQRRVVPPRRAAAGLVRDEQLRPAPARARWP